MQSSPTVGGLLGELACDIPGALHDRIRLEKFVDHAEAMAFFGRNDWIEK
jgi:hypothetical protein